MKWSCAGSGCRKDPESLFGFLPIKKRMPVP